MDKQCLHIVGKTICTNKEENSWGILTSKVNDEEKEILIIDSISHTNSQTFQKTNLELSTVVVGLEILLGKCGIDHTFNENDEIELTIKF